MASWTKEQERAIYTSGSDVLVAAAAGSGKTAVLVERIIQKLLHESAPVDIDSLLVVTFTNAAAQEMRNRVSEAISKALEDYPSSHHLKKQLALIQSASISTLHAFCMDIVRKYSYRLDIDPSFRIVDDIEGDLIQQEIMDELFEDWYGKEGEEREVFFSVVDRFSGDRSDQDVEKLILELYTFAMQNPWPEAWLDEMAAMYNVEHDINEDDIRWLQILKKEVHSQLHAMETEIDQALAIAGETDGPHHYDEVLEYDRQMVEEAKEHIQRSWTDLQTYMTSVKFKSLPNKKSDCDEDKKDDVKKLRDNYKKRWNTLRDEWFSRTLTSYISDMRELHPIIVQVIELVKDFKQRYTQLKKEKAVVDFSDLEHYCLEVLRDERSTPERTIPSTIALDLQRTFTEVLIDEYQDTNLVQETLLQLLTGEQGGHLFMVGDVKQSIYRFRHAEPALFLEKYKRYSETEESGERIDLARNFRSRQQVLSATNYIFRQILDEEVGEMAYEADAELIYSNTIYDKLTSNEADTELVIIDREDRGESGEDSDTDYRELEKAQLEARAYGNRIKKWLGNEETPPLQVIDKATETQRPVQYRDIVILMRSMTWAPTLVEELKRQGIPVYAELSTGYFEAIEIKVMLSLLKVIDNSQQDIPLASVLHSPIVGLDEEEMTQIRLANRRAGYYQALRSFAGDNQTKAKIDHFLNQLESWRTQARQGALSELIWDIFRDTGYYDFAGGMPGGRQRQANLRALYDRARSYESTSFRGLYRFLRFIDRMEERGDDLGAARALGEQEDVVRIMTIHKSKGLEFPVVILGAMDKQFNLMDLKDRYLLHKDFGFGTRYIDPKKRLMYPTLSYHALKQVKLRELLAEEMRVLYVALTRAKEKLVMIGNVSSFEKKQSKWLPFLKQSDWVLPPHYRMEARSYLDWVGPALIRHNDSSALRTSDVNITTSDAILRDESQWAVVIKHGSEFSKIDEEILYRDEQLRESIDAWNKVEDVDPSLLVDQRLNFEYPHQLAAKTRAKQSVTELKRQREVKDEYSSDQLLAPVKSPIGKRPKFMQESKQLTASEKGSAMHTVMQHLPLTQSLTEEEVGEFVEKLAEKEILSRDEADIIDRQAIAAFFDTEIGQRVLASQTIEREVPFSLNLPAQDVYDDWEGQTEEHVFVQGVIDCMIPYQDGWLLLDYKTDQLKDSMTLEGQQKLADRYRIQLGLYATALEKIWGEPVIRKCLYFFDGPLLLDV
ncbi:helicase-exonuclease AddAB subunit AddA [Thalassobacillus sp. CUG 92003]|uniref:helicase-exonuclease AddAB subunit AddA n=1 Tax=Thalassobacillus sp. CUG 92003 TaxID=2736641 RepID=UPI0015E78F55|nr:helicase-exonuclease AddAB subunit AddA [Thalassobacillus sp. CUG 92003]